MSLASVALSEIPVRVLFLEGEKGVYAVAAEEGAMVQAGALFVAATPGSAGIDLRASLTEDEVVIPPGGRFAVPSGVAIEVGAPGVAGFVFSRSGLGARDGLTVSQGVGVIDPDYRGEIIVWLLNTSGEPRTIKRGERMAQLIFLPFFRAVVEPVASLTATQRGEGGFGHTGSM